MVLEQRKVYNLLVLGPTGAGKSTFINGFYNYFTFENIDEALKETDKIKYVIPTAFTWCDEEGNSHWVTVGLQKDQSERQEIGKSATLNVKSYLFRFEDVAIRIIDTPGFGDTEGNAKDEKICENLFNFLSNCKELYELHGIVLILKPQENRMTTFFTYCMNQIFSKLHKGACENIILVFTHTKGTNYRPGSTLPLIREIIHKMPNKVPCDKNNIFCIENDSIELLLAHFYGENFVIFDERKVECENPWKHSSGDYIRLLKCIQTLKPHSLEDTILLNAIRCYCVKLQTVLPKVLQKISEETAKFTKYEKDIENCRYDVVNLSKVLYKNIIIKREGKYHVVCYNRRCQLNDGLQKICCQGCSAWILSSCSNFGLFNSTCQNCGCNQLDHAFQANLARKEEVEKELDVNIGNVMTGRQELLNKTSLELFEIKLNVKKYNVEKMFVEDWARKLSAYLQKLSIVSDQFTGEVQNVQEEIDIDIDKVLKQLVSLQMTGSYVQELLTEENIPIPEEKVYFIDKVLNMC